MKPRDARQQSELDELLPSNPWTHRSVPARAGRLLLCLSPTLAVAGVLTWLATPHWLLFTGLGAGLLLLVMSPLVIAPQWWVRVTFRLNSAPDADTSQWRRPGLP